MSQGVSSMALDETACWGSEYKTRRVRMVHTYYMKRVLEIKFFGLPAGRSDMRLFSSTAEILSLAPS